MILVFIAIIIASYFLYQKYSVKPVGSEFEEPITPDADSLNQYLDKEVNEFGQAAVNKFIIDRLNGKDEIDTETIDIKNLEDLTLLILGIINSQFDDSIINKERFENVIVKNGSFELPKYKLTRKDK